MKEKELSWIIVYISDGNIFYKIVEDEETAKDYIEHDIENEVNDPEMEILVIRGTDIYTINKEGIRLVKEE